MALTKSKALPHSDAKVEHDYEIVASYEYDKKKKKMVSYDTPEIAAHKADYVLQSGLGGAMWWESSADKQDGEGLIRIVGVPASHEFKHILLFRSKLMLILTGCRSYGRLWW